MFKKRFVTIYLTLFALLLSVPTAFASDTTSDDSTLPFILLNKNFAFIERTDAVIIDAGKNVNGSSLSVEDFDVHVKATRKVNPDFVAYDDARVVKDVYTSQVSDSENPSDTGRYIVIDFNDNG